MLLLYFSIKCYIKLRYYCNDISPQSLCPPKGVLLLFSVRLIDCVGYLVDGAAGAEEEGSPRMVTTPWFDHEIPMVEAAELGTRRVIAEHSTVGIVVTTDGSIGDIPRASYAPAEERRRFPPELPFVAGRKTPSRAQNWALV